MKGALLWLPVAAALERSSTVDKVVDLLGELRTKVQADLDAETVVMQTYTDWCTHESGKMEKMIKSLASDIQTEAGNIATAGAEITAQASNIGSAEDGISMTKDGIKGEVERRKGEHTTFVQEERELADAKSALNRAYDVLKRILRGKSVDNADGYNAFLQGSEDFDTLSRALASVSATAVFDEKADSGLKSFAQQMSSGPPQQDIAAYEPKSGVILQQVEKLKNQVEADHREIERKELQNRQTHEKDLQEFEQMLVQFQNDLAAAKEAHAQATADLGAAEKAHAVALKDHKAASTYHVDTTTDCTNTASAWATRQQLAKDEMDALSQASALLVDGVKVFAQESFIQMRQSNQDEDDKREQVVTLLRSLGRRFDSFGLLQAANAASADPFVQVRELINNMITKLQKQAGDEKTAHESCVERINGLKADIKHGSINSEKHADDIAKHESRIAELSKTINDERKAVKQLVGDYNQASALRDTNHAENTQTVADNIASADAVKDAIAILRDFYDAPTSATNRSCSKVKCKSEGYNGQLARAKFHVEGASDEEKLEQCCKKAGAATAEKVSDSEASPEPGFAGARNEASHSIIGILETAEEDMRKVVADTTQTEKDQVKAFVKLTKDKDETVKTKGEVINLAQSDRENRKKQTASSTATKEQVDIKLDGDKDQLKAWEQKCANNAMSYAERKQKRQAEIDGLKEALEILAADQSTAFLQRRVD